MSFEISIGDLRQLLLLLLLYGIFVGVWVTGLVSSGPITASDIISVESHYGIALRAFQTVHRCICYWGVQGRGRGGGRATENEGCAI